MNLKPALLACSLLSTMLITAVPTGANAGLRPGFWQHWGDGQAELTTYDLTYPRYGELRRGTAVTVFVTEPFALGPRVKSDGGRPANQEVPVMKLNLAQDFQTGIYDYNMMTSTFVALAERTGRDPAAAGDPLKVSFTAQEWCGHVYQQLLPDPDSVRYDSHSYFDGEADESATLERPPGGILEDALFHWARGFARPFLEPGETASVSALTSSAEARLRHRSPSWRPARLSRSAGTTEIEVAAGTFVVETATAEIDGGPTWTFAIEKAAPHRIIRWTTSDGQRGEMVASERLRYWQLSGNRDEPRLEGIGLEKRPPRTF